MLNKLEDKRIKMGKMKKNVELQEEYFTVYFKLTYKLVL